MTLEEAKTVKVGDKVIARLGVLSLPVECEVTEIIEGIERITFCLTYQSEDGKWKHVKRTHMRCWGIREALEQDRDKYAPKYACTGLENIDGYVSKDSLYRLLSNYRMTNVLTDRENSILEEITIAIKNMPNEEVTK